MRGLLIAAALTPALLVAGCGGGGGEAASAGAGDTSRDARFEEARLRFARCMRENGVDVGDPGENGVLRLGGPGRKGGRPDPEAFRRAEQKCRRHLEAAGPPPELSEEDQREFEQQALAFARCMREQGIDMPDPDVEGGGIHLRLPRGSDPGDPRFREAEEKCRKHAPRPPGVERAP